MCQAASGLGVDAANISASAIPMNIPLWAFRKKANTMIKSPKYEVTNIRSNSQFGEEVLLLNKYLFGYGNGLFLEIGALDGCEFSNTLALEKVLGWRGILIEGSPASYEILAQRRAQQVTMNAAICSKPAIVHYIDEKSGFHDRPTFGIYEFMDPGYISVWHKGLTEAPAKGKITCVPLKLLLNLLRVAHINFFSLDVEGAEFEVLSSIDFDLVTFDVLFVEGSDDKVKSLLESKGYFKTADEHDKNSVFLRNGFHPSAAPKDQQVTVTSGYEECTTWRSEKVKSC